MAVVIAFGTCCTPDRHETYTTRLCYWLRVTAMRLNVKAERSTSTREYQHLSRRSVLRTFQLRTYPRYAIRNSTVSMNLGCFLSARDG